MGDVLDSQQNPGTFERILDPGLSSTSHFALSPLESYLIFEFIVESACPILLLEENSLKLIRNNKNSGRF